MRQRTTWNQHQASDPPAMPGYQEKPTHPAAKPEDPGKDDYKSGDTSSWAEDPTKGPYPQSAAPQMPGYQEPPSHPAAKKAAMEMRAAMERKASKCIQMASAMLGPRATVAMVEDQALDFMNLSERQIQAALQRISTAFLAGEKKGEGEPEKTEGKKAEEPPKEEPPKEAGGKKSEDAKPEKKEAHGPFDLYDINLDDVISVDEWGGSPEIFAALDTDGDGLITRQDVIMGMGESFAAGIFGAAKSGDQNAPFGPWSPKKSEGGEAPSTPMAADPSDEEAEKMLAAMLAEEKGAPAPTTGGSVDAAAEKMLADMIQEEKGAAGCPMAEAPPAPAPTAVAEPPAPAPTAAAEPPMTEAELVDPMGLMDLEPTDEDLLSLYGMGTPKCAGEDEGEKTEEGEKKAGEEKPEEKPEAKEEEKPEKTASAQRPQPRKPSAGPKTLGPVTAKTASGKNEVDELSKLWESAPDVSSVFGR